MGEKKTLAVYYKTLVIKVSKRRNVQIRFLKEESYRQKNNLEKVRDSIFEGSNLVD